MQQWHAIVPFYLGYNHYVFSWHGGSPLAMKVEYLRRTVSCLQAAVPGIDVTVTVCTPESRTAALLVTDKVREITCEPRHLPFDSVWQILGAEGKTWNDDDILVFTEDDQMLFFKDSVRRDIEAHGGSYFFSPHRWSRTYIGLLERHGRRPYKLDHVRGMLENVSRTPGSLRKVTFNHRYGVQENVFDAYAALWAAQVSLVRSLDLDAIAAKNPYRDLAFASFGIFHSGKPILKLDPETEEPADFIVDHLSGYDYFRKMYTWKSLWWHLKKIRKYGKELIHRKVYPEYRMD